MLRPQLEPIELLVEMATAGKEEAWTQIVRTYSPVVWAAIRRCAVPEAIAADVYQTVWLRLVVNIRQIRDPKCLPAWLTVAARRECLRALRTSVKLRFNVPLHDVADSALSPEELCVLDGRARLVRRALGRLPERDRRLLLALMADRRPDYGTVSIALQMPQGSIGPTRARALARLRGELAQLGIIEYAQIA